MSLDVGVGDIVKVTQTVEITRMFEGRPLHAIDVSNGHNRIVPALTGSVRFEMVKRAARPKPKAGDVLTGAEIGRIQWKRGTVIRCVRLSGGRTMQGNIAALALFADGKWHDVEGFSSYEFDDLQRDAGFELLLVA